ncbi:tRNA 2'-phosphotransferase 1-like [Clavelina lepadiformis]|uniref:2'-phosphotransferase n=1 Tax=Clavelina lepadiformis TaxID=159417 RepID=A0ABP0GP75_CLALP
MASFYGDVAISKELVRILRHGKYGVKLDTEGFLSVDEVLHLLGRTFQNTSLQDIQRIVNSDNKKRYELKHVDSKWMIKATQGHTVKVTGLGLTEITDPNKYKVVAHGTYSRNWSNIQKYGLSRMRRTHIHFAIGLHGDQGVISGMPHSCDVVIYIDLPLALQGGIKFYESSNKVILSEGDSDGLIYPKYFKKVVQLRPFYKELTVNAS